MAKKDTPPASELLESNLVFEDDTPSGGDTPFDRTYDALVITGGKKLELLTRTQAGTSSKRRLYYDLQFQVCVPTGEDRHSDAFTRFDGRKR